MQLAKANEKNVVTKIEILSEDEMVIAEIGDDVILGTDNYDCEYNQGTQAKLSFSVPNIYIPAASQAGFGIHVK